MIRRCWTFLTIKPDDPESEVFLRSSGLWSIAIMSAVSYQKERLDNICRFRFFALIPDGY